MALLLAAASVGLASAGTEDLSDRLELRRRVISFGVICEDMCKSVGAYPNCKCAGFGGTPADDSDTRSCAAKYCHPPVEPCPNDHFFNCVKEGTKLLEVSALPPMGALVQELDGVRAGIAAYAAAPGSE